MKIISADNGKEFKTIFDSLNQTNGKVQMGVVRLAQVRKRPLEGFARHTQDEFSYVIKGSAHTVFRRRNRSHWKSGRLSMDRKPEKGISTTMMAQKRLRLCGFWWNDKKGGKE